MSEALYQPFPMRPGHQAQAWRHQPAYRRPRHFHREPELNLVFRGRAVMGLGSHALEMGRGDVLLIRPGQDHELLRASDDLELFVVALTPAVAEQCVAGLARVDAQPLRLSAEETARAWERLVALSATACPHDSARVVGDLFATCARRFDAGHALSRKAFHAASSAPAVRAGTLARQLRVHPSELGRHFRRDLGLRFVEFRMRLRLMKFIEQVDRGESLTRAALEASFGSYTQCHRTFLRYLGCSPRQYFGGRRRSLDAMCTPAPSDDGHEASFGCSS